MAKRSKKTSRRSSSNGSTRKSASNGKAQAAPNLVIVESPAKAKTINRYLGNDYTVMASVGHVRDLPKRNPKGVKAPVPGVDLDKRFTPTYEVISGKNKTVNDLKRLAKQAENIWLATDMDREGEAIAWHLLEAMNVDPAKTQRVVFNAITKDEIANAFSRPRSVDMDKVNAQQARRILDRIVGYQVSPLLWKKVAGGLSAGRVQSVAVRLVVEREREIEAFVPDEYWKITAIVTPQIDQADQIASDYRGWLKQMHERDPSELPPQQRKNPGPTQREKIQWLSERDALELELVEIRGDKAELPAEDIAQQIAEQLGMTITDKKVVEDPKGKGPAARRVELIGQLDAPLTQWTVDSIQTKRTKSRPAPPFITSTLQQAAANRMGFSASGTMRIAQQLYEGIDLGSLGQVGLITYMRTDSTHLSREAINAVRQYIGDQFGDRYLPEKPNFYSSSNKQAQEAHEAIRPTDVTLSPDHPQVSKALNDQQYKLYRLIWNRFVACQMTPAEWDSTTVNVAAPLRDDGQAIFRGSGRVLVFDGQYRVMGVPNSADDPVLPPLEEGQPIAALNLDPKQHFTAPPPRYSEASLVKKLESEGIGRPSTYASIISVIQDRKYVEKIDGRFHATDLGMVVTDKLLEAFPRIMEVGYTREMESQLDDVEENHQDWVAMLEKFYGPFKQNLDEAYEQMSHAKAETQPAPYTCPKCGSATMYRFGKNGRFLSCATYPDCDYAAPINREGEPVEPEHTDIACPLCSNPMMLRKGRYGLFLSCSNYPTCKGIVNLDNKGMIKFPSAPPLTTDLECPKCESPLNLRRSKRGPWLSCSTFPKCRGRLGWTKVDEEKQKELEQALAKWEKEHPQPTIRKLDGTAVPDQYKPRVISEASSDSTGTEETASDELSESYDAA